MDMNKYQQLAERTATRSEKDTAEERFTHFCIGLAGEVGEVVDYLKKVLFHNHPLDKQKLAEELGDVIWYVATLATTANIPLDYVAQLNIDKLYKRYPEGFDVERSINRDAN